MYYGARIYRRTGRYSFAVQLVQLSSSPATHATGCSSHHEEAILLPGLVEVHCCSVDWGYMAEDHARTKELEQRLCKLGTLRGMMSARKDAESKSSLPERKRGASGPIMETEGVTIRLGPFDAVMRAFVQCELRVCLEECAMWEPCVLRGGEEREEDEKGAVGGPGAGGGSSQGCEEKPVRGRRRSFRWWKQLVGAPTSMQQPL